MKRIQINKPIEPIQEAYQSMKAHWQLQFLILEYEDKTFVKINACANCFHFLKDPVYCMYM